MKQVILPLPFGSPKTFMDIHDGSSLSISLFLLMSGLLLIVLSGAKPDNTINRITFVIALSLAGISVLSWIYFFPLPSICVGLGSILSLGALKKS